jgi:hypothetical protein
MHKRSSSEEYLELAEMCLLEAERTLDRETADRLLTMARRYLDEAKRIREKSLAMAAAGGGQSEQRQSYRRFSKIT